MTDGEKGQTALHKAAWFQRRTICVMLVGAGASLTKTDFQGKTPRIQVSLLCNGRYLRLVQSDYLSLYDSILKLDNIHDCLEDSM